MADYDWFSEQQDATFRQHVDDEEKRTAGFTPVYGDNLKVVYYRCRRGCGTLVWDVDAHVKNVCPQFNPVVGNA